MSIYGERVEHIFKFLVSGGYDDMSTAEIAFTYKRFGQSVIDAALDRYNKYEGENVKETTGIVINDAYGSVEVGFMFVYKGTKLERVKLARFHDVNVPYIDLTANFNPYISAPLADGPLNTTVFYLADYDPKVEAIAAQLKAVKLIEPLRGAGIGQYGNAKITQWRVTQRGMMYYMGEEQSPT